MSDRDDDVTPDSGFRGRLQAMRDAELVDEFARMLVFSQREYEAILAGDADVHATQAPGAELHAVTQELLGRNLAASLRGLADRPEEVVRVGAAGVLLLDDPKTNADRLAFLQRIDAEGTGFAAFLAGQDLDEYERRTGAAVRPVDA